VAVRAFRDEPSLAGGRVSGHHQIPVIHAPTDLSRPETASELSVSVNTVNTHVRNIYAKLRARDRSSAVQRARELRLLSTGLTR
jgi:LuxR family maltose regulon positive regulatory protein